MMSAFRLLAAARRLRSTPLDPPGRTAERRQERAIIGDYERLVRELFAQLTLANHKAAVDFASLPDEIRSYGHVKDAATAAAAVERDALLARFRSRVRVQAIVAK